MITWFVIVLSRLDCGLWNGARDWSPRDQRHHHLWVNWNSSSLCHLVNARFCNLERETLGGWDWRSVETSVWPSFHVFKSYNWFFFVVVPPLPPPPEQNPSVPSLLGPYADPDYATLLGSFSSPVSTPVEQLGSLGESLEDYKLAFFAAGHTAAVTTAVPPEPSGSTASIANLALDYFPELTASFMAGGRHLLPEYKPAVVPVVVSGESESSSNGSSGVVISRTAVAASSVGGQQTVKTTSATVTAALPSFAETYSPRYLREHDTFSFKLDPTGQAAADFGVQTATMTSPPPPPPPPTQQRVSSPGEYFKVASPPSYHELPSAMSYVSPGSAPTSPLFSGTASSPGPFKGHIPLPLSPQPTSGPVVTAMPLTTTIATSTSPPAGASTAVAAMSYGYSSASSSSSVVMETMTHGRRSSVSLQGSSSTMSDPR